MFGSCNFLWHILKEPVQKFIYNSPIFCHLQPREIKEQCLEWRRVFLFSGLRIVSIWRFCLWVQLQFCFHCHLKSVILWESFKKISSLLSSNYSDRRVTFIPFWLKKREKERRRNRWLWGFSDPRIMGWDTSKWKRKIFQTL